MSRSSILHNCSPQKLQVSLALNSMKKYLKSQPCPACKDICNFNKVSEGFLSPSYEYTCDSCGARVHIDNKSTLLSSVGLIIVTAFNLIPIKYSNNFTHIMVVIITLSIAVGFVYYANKKRRLVQSKII